MLNYESYGNRFNNLVITGKQCFQQPTLIIPHEWRMKNSAQWCQWGCSNNYWASKLSLSGMTLSQSLNFQGISKHCSLKNSSILWTVLELEISKFLVTRPKNLELKAHENPSCSKSSLELLNKLSAFLRKKSHPCCRDDRLSICPFKVLLFQLHND